MTVRAANASSPAAMGDGDHKPVVILVVGNKHHDKRRAVDSITRSGEWDYHTTADVRILTCRSTGRIVVETTPLINIPGKSPTAIARRWISRNSLRRILLDKLVVVVCVITCTIRETCKWEMFSYSNCWVDVVGLIFSDHKGGILMLVNTDGVGGVVPEVQKAEVEHFVVEHLFSTKQVIYSNLMEGGDSVGRVIDGSILLWSKGSHDGKMSRLQTLLGANSRRQGEDGQNRHRTKLPKEASYPPITPFLIDVSSDKGKFGPWGPERVFLFGRTGSGKSTLAQMLTMGALDPHNQTFVSSSGIRGGTNGIEHGEGRGWYVLDTPGFGEPKVAASTITTQEAEKKIKKYVKLLEGTFSHYVYVVKKDRLDQLEERLWRFFLQLFGEDIKLHFSVVVSNADEEWVLDNDAELRACFKGCESFLSAEFPAIDEQDAEAEGEYQRMREESLRELEERLAKLNRVDIHCIYGKNSKMHVRNERDRSNVDMGIQKDLRIQFLNEGAKACFAISSCISLLTSHLSELTSLLTVDDNIALLPG